MTEQAPARVVDQRIRNRILDCFGYFADGNKAVRTLGYGDYFEFFFDWLAYDGEPDLPKTMSDEEVAVTLRVLKIVREAMNDTPSQMADEDFIATGWPELIRPVAAEAVGIFMERGRSNEDVEESGPGTR